MEKDFQTTCSLSALTHARNFLWGIEVECHSVSQPFAAQSAHFNILTQLKEENSFTLFTVRNLDFFLKKTLNKKKTACHKVTVI